MMKPLPSFWRAIEDTVGTSTDRLEWQELLGDEWHVAHHLLRPTGQLAKQIACPSPGGDGCPRHVVPHRDGTFSAVCGDSPRRCSTLRLSRADVAILAVDRPKLTRQLAVVFGTRGDVSTQQELRNSYFLGRHMVAAGLGAPVYVSFPGSRDELREAGHTFVHLASGPFVLLTPTGRLVDLPLAERVRRSGSMLLALEDTIGLGAEGRLVGTSPAHQLLKPVREAMLRSALDSRSAPVWLLPPDASWGELILEFDATQMLKITFRDETRRFEPVDLGMRDNRTKQPSLQWTLLRQMALAGGRLSWTDEGAGSRIKKQKQELSDKLKAAFGIHGSPIEWDSSAAAYVARFVLRTGRLRHDAEQVRPSPNGRRADR
ncbi:MAG: hypothetical protein M3O70_22465 [Actinomycetota bacterium]|nr:hypothetical protein [Actinomycetota bacterium]